MTTPKHLLPSGPYSGSIDPLFLCADNMTLGQALADRSPDSQALSDSEKHRLVKASKSRTLEETLQIQHKRALFNTDLARLQHNHDWMLKTGEIPEPVITEHEHKPYHTPHNAPGCRAIVEFKEWADEWRLRTEVDGQNLQPPEQSGQRISEMLSHRGASKIAESCAFMSVCKGGYKTFVTGTFNDEVREKIASGDTTVQKEVSRTMNTLQKMYQRGWTTKTGERVQGHADGLPYCWVVEVPKNEQGEDNPHIHMLLGWRVEYKYFAEWAARIESIWGNGYFHLEKIKDSTCAGAYMAKAAGYLSKAQDNDTQGEVKGNRYGISAIARAPGWAIYAKAQMHIVSQLIVDVYDHLTVKFGEQFRERSRLNKTLAKIPKDKKGLRQRLGKKLAKVREELNALPIRCNKYQVVIKGRGEAYRFFNWCVNEVDHGNEYLPEKEAGMAWDTGSPPQAKDSLYFHKLYKTINHRKFWRRLQFIPEWLYRTDTEWHQVKGEYEKINQKEPEYRPDMTLSTWQEYSQVLSTPEPEKVNKSLDSVPETSGSLWDRYFSPPTGFGYA